MKVQSRSIKDFICRAKFAFYPEAVGGHSRTVRILSQ